MQLQGVLTLSKMLYFLNTDLYFFVGLSGRVLVVGARWRIEDASFPVGPSGSHFHEVR